MDERPEPSCCTRVEARVDPRIARRFDLRASAWSATTGFPPMVDVSAVLLAQLGDVATRHPTVLEFGCGTGALSVALLEREAARATGIDLSEASLDVARRRAASAGVDERATFIGGNAAAMDVEPHDWVILDRSICCFSDVNGLITAAIASARERVAISVPESRGWRGLLNRVRLGAKTMWDELRGGCRSYVHRVDRIEAQLARAGFRSSLPKRVHHGRWLIAVYQR
jgi:SAM-dependent methyltransferase